MTPDQLAHHYQDIRVLDDGEEFNHYHYVMVRVDSPYAMPQQYRMVTRRMKLLGTAIGEMEFAQEQNPEGHYVLVTAQAGTIL